VTATPGAAGTAPEARDEVQPRRASTPLFLVGLLARTWLWFVAGCLVVTILPVVIGWRPFVIESGSMSPRIEVGDIVLAAPADDAQQLLGRVAVFDDPDVPGRTKTHRVVSIADDGSLTTKGDANPTVDPTSVQMSDVRGLGRLLVSFAGLPLVWLHSGQLGWLALFVLSLLLAAFVVGKDRDDEPTDDSDPTDGDRGSTPTRLSKGSVATAASTPADPGLARTARRPWKVRALYVTVLAAVLVVPTQTAAAFNASSVSSSNNWTTGAFNTYQSVVSGLSPWMWWRLDDSGTGTAVADASGNSRPGAYLQDASSTYVTKGVTGALVTNTTNRAITLTGASSCLAMASGTNAVSSPGSLTELVWFKTTTTSGGKLLGFESPRTGVTAFNSGGRYDRHLYMDAAGQIWFGTQSGSTRTAIKSASALNNGAWHLAAGVLSGTSMRLYIDGALASSATVSAPTSYNGWWRAGCGNLSGWGGFWDGGGSPSGSLNQGRDFPFAGSLDEATVWTSALTGTQVASIYAAR